MPQPCRVTSFRSGPVDYVAALSWQRRLQVARQAKIIPDTLLLLEHTPVVTVGRGSRDLTDLTAGEDGLASRGIALAMTDRGGEMTYHAPGQLVGYPILDLSTHGSDLHRYLRDIEETIIRALSVFGVSGGRIPGLTGVWVGQEKICAIGIKVSRWVTIHGFALNNDIDLSPFQRDFVPCGIHDKGVTSLAQLGVTAKRIEVEQACLGAFAEVMGVEFANVTERGMLSILADLAYLDQNGSIATGAATIR